MERTAKDAKSRRKDYPQISQIAQIPARLPPSANRQSTIENRKFLASLEVHLGVRLHVCWTVSRPVSARASAPASRAVSQAVSGAESKAARKAVQEAVLEALRAVVRVDFSFQVPVVEGFNVY
jgi:hypothetical protein